MGVHYLIAQLLQPIVRRVPSSELRTIVFLDETVDATSCQLGVKTRRGSLHATISSAGELYHIRLTRASHASLLALSSFQAEGTDLRELLLALMQAIFPQYVD